MLRVRLRYITAGLSSISGYVFRLPISKRNRQLHGLYFFLLVKYPSMPENRAAS
jgi:hypothetical protein